MSKNEARIFRYDTNYEVAPSVLLDRVLRECIELCARVAEIRSGHDIAAAIRRLKPVARWP